jgi:drug/metabolite transporter (DMT)-like permease
VTPRDRSRAQLLAAATLFSTAGAAIKYCRLDAWELACFRAGLAAVALFLLLPAARRGWSWRTALVAVNYAAMVILFVRANKLTTAASTIFLQATSSLYIVALGPLLLRERARRRDLLTLLTVGGGLVLLVAGAPPPARSAPDPATGNLLAALSGLSSALMLIGLRWLGRHPAPVAFDGGVADADQGGAAPAVVMGNVLAFVVCLPFAIPVAEVRAIDWALVAFLGVFQIALAYALLIAALRHMAAIEASLLLFIEPVLNPLWAWLVQGEQPGAWAWAGGLLILSGTLLRAVWDARTEA